MEYAYLGRSGLYVSRICLGCMSYGTSKWRPWVLDEEPSQDFFRRAIESGINFFDTADMYSLGVSEEVTGRALKKYGNLHEIVLATKVRFPMTNAPNMGGLSRKHIVQGCEDSLRRLGVETIDLYQIHRMDKNIPIEETLAALDHLVHSGKVRYLGCSTAPAWRFMKSLTISERNGWAKFVAMQNHYNLIYREEEREMIPLCVEEGVGVIPWSPLARGILAGTRTKLDDKESTARAESDSFTDLLYNEPTDWDVVEALLEVAKARSDKPAKVALAWLLHKNGVTAPIVGATKMTHLEDAIEAVDLKLTPEEIDKLEAPYRAHPVKGMYS